jgi:5-methyltetrahydropteroyltriglutamate--homocysteine methyltransferase
VVTGVDDLRLGLHVCRGNWSRDEMMLLSGGHQALRTYLDGLQTTQLVLEYATDRAGTLVGFEGREIGLGVVNPSTDQVETPEKIRAAVEEALRLYPAERVFLNADCGFGTFSNRPMATREIASAKVAVIAAAARDLTRPFMSATLCSARTNRVSIGPESRGERLIHDGRGRCADLVGFTITTPAARRFGA